MSVQSPSSAHEGEYSSVSGLTNGHSVIWAVCMCVCVCGTRCRLTSPLPGCSPAHSCQFSDCKVATGGDEAQPALHRPAALSGYSKPIKMLVLTQGARTAALAPPPPPPLPLIAFTLSLSLFGAFIKDGMRKIDLQGHLGQTNVQHTRTHSH